MELRYHMNLKIQLGCFLKIEFNLHIVKVPISRSALALSQNFTFKYVHFIFYAVNTNVTYDLLTFVVRK
jgi:hypothetical protein